jgi:hypothetical protein
MKVYAPATNRGRTAAVDDVNHRTADSGSKRARDATAKRLKRAARQQGRALAKALQP